MNQNEETLPCTHCDEEGIVKCKECEGTGKWYDPGEYYDFHKCRKCEGTGNIECSWCYGKGRIANYVRRKR